MASFRKGSTIFFILFFPIFLFGQNQDSIRNIQIARNLYFKGIELIREGLDVQALDTFKLYLDYRKKIYGEENFMLGSPYMAVGIGYNNLGQIDKALDFYQLAEQNYLLRNDSNITSLARLYRNIGNAYRAKLDYPNALNYNERALNIFQNQNPIDNEDVSDAHYAIAEIHFLMGNYKTALEIASRSYDKSDDYTKIYLGDLIANIEQGLGNNLYAQKYYINTINLVKKYYGEKHFELAIAYMNYAEFLSTIHQFDEGLKMLNNAYEIIKTTQETYGIELASYYEYMGDLIKSRPIESRDIYSFKQQKKKNLYEAISWYNKSKIALNNEGKDIDINEIEIGNCLSFTDCLVLLKSVGDTYSELAFIEKEDKNEFYVKSLIDALEYYNVISELIQRARKEISSDESKIQLAELQHSTFSKMIETAFLVYEATRQDEYFELAFSNSEQLKNSAIFDKISDDIARENSLIPDSLLQLEQKLNNTITIYSEKRFEENSYEEPDSNLLREYNQIIFDASRDRDELNRYLEENYSDYYNLKYSESMLSAGEIQKMMEDEEAIIEYVFNETDTVTELYTFLITNDKKRFTKQVLDRESQKSIEDLFYFMSNRDYLFTKNKDALNYCISANRLYSLLIEPFKNDIHNKNLVLIPDGKLNYISFDALLSSLPDTSKAISFNRLDYVIRDYNINYANSANILFKNRRKSQKIKNRVLAFAPEYNREQFEMNNSNYFLMPLPGVRKEVESISKTIRTKIFSGDEASETNFRENCTDYDILHLAMHAFINDSVPAYSRLAFSPNNHNSDLGEDGWLNTTDIYNLDLNARLTVLSACNTGIGKLQKGEGIMSLARGFLYAGCPSIVMSLWEVEDESGTRIMSSFYKNLKKGKPKDEALRLAKLSYLENSNSRQAHPHYWMGYVSIGDNSPIYTSYDVYFFALLILIILGFTIEQTIRIKKARRERQAL